MSETQRILAERFLSTLILILLITIARWAGIRVLRKARFNDADTRRRWIVQYKNAMVLVLLVGIVIIWAAQLRSFALGLVALAVAIVVATKEMILCLLGGLLKASTRPFDIGDSIEIAHARGQVIDHNLFTTTLMEMGPEGYLHQYTGRTVVLPNSLFLTQSLFNFTSSNRYVLHTFLIPARPPVDWRKIETALLSAAEEECAPYLREARSYMELMGHKEGLDSPSADPRVSLHLTETERWDFVVRLPVPAARRGKIEQAVLKRFLDKIGPEGRIGTPKI
ncbi:mechanosensitive ion channel family protein [bacterium]|nr:mechanosensitive ion channel family protein [bacterium]